MPDARHEVRVELGAVLEMPRGKGDHPLEPRLDLKALSNRRRSDGVLVSCLVPVGRWAEAAAVRAAVKRQGQLVPAGRRRKADGDGQRTRQNAHSWTHVPHAPRGKETNIISKPEKAVRVTA